jgi:hypothetical protein
MKRMLVLAHAIGLTDCIADLNFTARQLRGLRFSKNKVKVLAFA